MLLLLSDHMRRHHYVICFQSSAMANCVLFARKRGFYRLKKKKKNLELNIALCTLFANLISKFAMLVLKFNVNDTASLFQVRTVVCNYFGLQL